jgi:hypothetical protein
MAIARQASKALIYRWQIVKHGKAARKGQPFSHPIGRLMDILMNIILLT